MIEFLSFTVVILCILYYRETRKCFPVAGLLYRHRRVEDFIIEVVDVDYSKVYYMYNGKKYTINTSDFEKVFTECTMEGIK